MSKKLKIAFLWHMHQPYYKNDKVKQTLMPWVFLHSIKDYYDIPWYSLKFNNIKATYNLVPSLIYQLKTYIDNSANDKLLEIIKKPISILTNEDLDFLDTYLFLANTKNMIKPLTRYYNLYLKYKAHGSIKEFSETELLDTQILFLLSWCGNYLRQNNNIVKYLLHKGEYFTHEEKLQLLGTLIEFLPQILELYKEQRNDGKISLSTTPYYHPITPLLLDINSAKEARIDVVMPAVISNFSEFGQDNTIRAIEYFEEIFDFKPTGFWPAEGSVSLETAELFSQNNLKWFCTDEEILFKTINNRDKKNIYKNYKLKTISNTIDIRFRDHFLSDMIGFGYSNKEPKIAAKEFVNHLKVIYDSCNFSPLVNIILDGENAWEYFPNNAQDFFDELYSLFESTPWLETVTMDEIQTNTDIQTVNLTSIASGSWINGNFDIWIGSDEKNKAWELLDLTKQDYNKNKEHLTTGTNEQIQKEFMIALGSDWFWWYGDDHFTVQAQEFDELFRTHLINIYLYMNIDIPSKLYIPIVKSDYISTFHIPPKDFIHPIIDGLKNDYFEWLDSGIIDITKEFSVMDSTKSVITLVRYGYSQDSIFFLFEGKYDRLKNSGVLEVTIGNNLFTFDIIYAKQELLINNKNVELFCSSNYIELKISRDILINDEIQFSFALKKGMKTVQSFPLYNDFFIKITNFKLLNWFV